MSSFNWPPEGGSSSGGDVVGPGSSTDNAAARFDGTTGKLLQNSLLIIGDTGNVTGIADLTVTGTTTLATSLTGIVHAVSGLLSASLIVNADVSAAAAIAYSKLNLTGSIVNADVSVSAAIAFSKLAALTSANILVGSAGNVATAVAVTGDISLTNGGVTAYSGTVPLLKGGTGTAAASANAAFNALSPLTTKGDVLTFSTVNARLGVGSDGQVLTADAAQTLGIKWATPTTGTVTSVALAVPATSILGVSGSPVTGSGTLTLTTTGTSGGVPYFSSTSQLTSSALLTASAIVLGGGAGAAPASLGSLGTTTTVLHGNAAGAPTFGAIVNADITNGTIDLAAKVTGLLPLANGGTNKNMTAVTGGVVWTDADSMEVSAAGTSGQYLKSNGTSAPAFASFTSPTIQKFTSGSGNYTTAANVLYIKVRMVGAGGGGGGSANSTANGGTGGTGGNTTFGSSLLVANGGVGGGANSNPGGTGGTASLGTGPIGTALTGGGGAGGDSHSATAGVWAGGAGAASFFGGQGKSNGAGVTNTGGGGGGAEGPSLGFPGSGGGSGGYVEALIIPTAGQVFAYAVGAAGTAGSAGTGGSAGGIGGSGYIEVTECYQ